MKESEAMWLLANMQPATPQELAEFTGESVSSIHTVLRNLRGHGFVQYRTRKTDTKGTDPYEYTIRRMEDRDG